jgi:hypothetical protein
MAEMGHTDPKLALSIYAQAMRRDEGEGERLRALVEGADWAAMGSGGLEADSAPPAGDAPSAVNPHEREGSEHGRGGFRTCDLSRVKRDDTRCAKSPFPAWHQAPRRNWSSARRE